MCKMIHLKIRQNGAYSGEFPLEELIKTSGSVTVGRREDMEYNPAYINVVSDPRVWVDHVSFELDNGKLFAHPTAGAYLEYKGIEYRGRLRIEKDQLIRIGNTTDLHLFEAEEVTIQNSKFEENNTGNPASHTDKIDPKDINTMLREDASNGNKETSSYEIQSIVISPAPETDEGTSVTSIVEMNIVANQKQQGADDSQETNHPADTIQASIHGFTKKDAPAKENQIEKKQAPPEKKEAPPP